MQVMKSARVSLLLAAFISVLFPLDGSAQQPADAQLKEVQLGARSFSLADPIPSWVVPASPAKPEAGKSDPIVIRLADTQFMVGREPATFVRRATLVNDVSSLSALGRTSISFSPEYERVELHAIRILRGDTELDKTKTLNIRFLQREQALEQGVYSGRVTASILVDDLRVGDTLDVSYTVYGQNPVFGGKYYGLTGWDQPFPTLYRRAILNYPAERPIAWRMLGDRPTTPIAPKESADGNMRRIEFEQRSMPATIVEPQVAPEFFAFRFIQFSEFQSWNEVALWARALFDRPGQPVAELAELVGKLRALETDEPRVVAALEFVQSEIRYFSVSLGESSHRPAAPSEVLRRRYGDCKDKSLLLIALLKELGIEARPVLLQIGHRSGLEKALPSVQFFNHVIVQVALGSRTFFLDPTRLGQHGKLDRIGQAEEGTQILVVAPDTRELSTIATPNIAELLTDELEERATLAKFGADGQIETKRILRGAAAERLRIMLERTSNDQVLKWIGDAMERRYPGAKLVGQPTVRDDRIENVFTIGATYAVPKLATEREGNWAVYFAPTNLQNVVVSSPSATRTMPLRLGAYPYSAKYSFEINFPEEVSVVSDPSSETVTNKYFILNASRYFRGNVARKSIELTTLGSSVDAQDYGKYSEDLGTANKAIGGLFFVSKSSIRSTDNAAATSFPERLRALTEEGVKKTTETIAGGKLSGADLSYAYCDRSLARGDLGRHDEALQDANEAIRLAPNSSAAFVCRAQAHFKNGQFDKSVADYSKAIALGATETTVFRERGTSKLAAGRLEEAATDYAKAYELADNPEARTFSGIWLAVAYGRLGKPVPEALVAQAAAEKTGQWPRPALAMLTGALSPQELLKLIDEKKGDDRQMALSEGYLYLAERSLALGDIDGARNYLEKSREQQVIVYTEHTVAGFELQRLGNAAKPAAVAMPKRAD